MNQVVQRAALGAAVVAPLASHSALAMGQGYGVALALAAVQAVAAGVALWAGAVPRWRWLGPALAALLLAALAAGARRSAAAGVLAGAGLSHALLYGALLAVFARSLRPGRTSLVTAVASRINPHFHAGMVPYTRKATAAWCVFFGGQLALSAVLLVVAPGWWRVFVTALHLPAVAAMAVGEVLVRKWRWRHEHATGLLETIRGVRRLRGEAAAGRTSRPGEGCRDHSGSATRPLPRLEGSAPGRSG